jgi:metal-sulfur cluster biosynthetic enzyme
MNNEVTEQQIKDALSEVYDPELNISIVDLGLVYEVQVNSQQKVKVIMTLTTIGCPLFGTIEQEIKSKLSEIGVPEENVELELTFDPPWSMEKMSESAKAMLGI